MRTAGAEDAPTKNIAPVRQIEDLRNRILRAMDVGDIVTDDREQLALSEVMVEYVQDIPADEAVQIVDRIAGDNIARMSNGERIMYFRGINDTLTVLERACGLLSEDSRCRIVAALARLDVRIPTYEEVQP